MNGALAIAAVEIRRLLRDRTSLLFVVALPVLVITVIGSASFDADDGLPVGLHVVRDGPAVDALERSDLVDVRHVSSRADVAVGVRLGDTAGGVVIDGDQVTLVIDPASGNATATRAAVNGILARESAVLGVADAYDLDPAGVRTIAGELERVSVERTAIGADGTTGGDGGDYDEIAAANLVLFTFLNSLAVGAGMVASKELGIYGRWRSSPVRRRSMIAGLVASRLVFALFQAGVILVVGAVAFGVSWGDPVAVAALVVLFALVSTGVGVFFGVVSRSPEQTSAVGIPVGIGLGMLGGCLWSLDVVPATMRTIGHATPHAWAMDAFDHLAVGGGVGDVGLELLVLLGFAAVVLAAAIRAADRRLL